MDTDPRLFYIPLLRHISAPPPERRFALKDRMAPSTYNKLKGLTPEEALEVLKAAGEALAKEMREHIPSLSTESQDPV